MMSMLYKINNDYYIRVGRKYIKVDMVVKGDNILVTPDNKSVIEHNNSLKVTEVKFDDAFKKAFIESQRKRAERTDDIEITHSRYR